MPKVRNSVIQRCTQNYDNAMRFYSQIKNVMGSNFRPGRVRRPDGSMATQDEIEQDITNFAVVRQTALASQTILFSAEQCEAFWQLIEKGDVPDLEYKLPFQDVILEFTQPVIVMANDGTTLGLRPLVGLMLTQIEVDKSQYEKTVKDVEKADDAFGFSRSHILPIDWSKSNKAVINRVGFIDKDFDVEQIVWTSQMSYAEIVAESLPDIDIIDWRMNFKSLAIACIGYINCENVRLERVEQADEATNAKRERKGKSRLEPYYICRIRGVQHDSITTGTGAKHAIRYDVRGHFRRMTNGKTTWVRPHQRGLQNELYIPKTYLVEKGVKDNGRG